MAVEPVIVADGGLDLISSRQSTAPGALIDCENFERTNSVGYQRISGIRSYSGQCVLDVIDPLIIWQYNHPTLSELYGNLSFGDPFSGTIKWGEGGSFDLRNNTINSQDGRGVISYFHPAPFPLIPADFSATIVGIEGRIFRPGDTLISVSTPSLTNDVTNTSSYSAIGTVSEIFNSFIPGLGSLTSTYSMLEKIGGSFDKLYSSFSYRSGRKPGGICVPASMYGYVCGGFFWKDKLHVIADIEAWEFTDWNAELNVGDTLNVYVTGVHGVGTYTFQQAKVEDIVVTSGSMEAGDAAGVIYLTALTSESRGGLFSVKVPTMTRNQTTGVSDPLTLTSRIVSDRAAMWVDTGKYYPTDSGWARCDLGYEVQFNYGEVRFKVLNRLSEEEDIYSNPLAFPSSSSWASASVADAPIGWTNASNILALDASEAIGGNSPQTAALYNGTAPIEIRDFSTAFAGIPDNAVIVGIEVRITKRKVFTPSAFGAEEYVAIVDREVSLVGVGETPQNKASFEYWPSILTASTYGGSTDTWGCSLSASVVKSSSFGVKLDYRFRYFAVGGSPGILSGHAGHVDAVEMRVHYVDPSSKVVICTPTTPAQSVSSITRSGTTATLTKSAHGYTNGQVITVAGASQTEYNGAFPIRNVTTNTFDYTVTGTPVTPATGTITCQLIGSDISEAKVVWYHKAKGDWGGSPKSEGTLTLTEITAPAEISAGMQIRSAASGGGILYALTTSGANKIYMAPSAALETNGSKYQFDVHNFYGSQNSEQVFGVSGADFAFSWDGKYLIKLRTGLDPAQDKPRHIARHIDQLALGYYSGAVTLSDQGYPESYAGQVDGPSPPSEDPDTFPGFIPSATNNPTGDSVYGLLESDNRTLIVGCKGSIRSIIGGGFNIAQEVMSSESGVLEYSMAMMNGQILFMNHRGLQSLPTSMTNQAISEYVSPFLIPRIQSTHGAIGQISGIECIGLVRSKNQYRIYFRDRKILTITLTNNGPMCTIQRMPFVPKWIASGTTLLGKDMIFCGTYSPASVTSENDLLRAAYNSEVSNQTPASGTHALVGPNIYSGNYVYQMDVGSTWDDLLPINAYLTINVGNLGAEMVRKRFNQMIMSGKCYGFANFGVQFAINYGSIESSVTNVNAGNATGSPLMAFSEQTFSREVSIGRDGYALSVKVVSGGSNAYGNATLLAQTTPYYIRPFSIQALTIFTENQRVRRT